jgi:hypothetical protein
LSRSIFSFGAWRLSSCKADPHENRRNLQDAVERRRRPGSSPLRA